jgi:hypothetical protein
MWSQLHSSSGGNECTGVVSVRSIALAIGEEHMACSDTIEILAGFEVKPEGPLHVESLEASDRQAKGSGGLVSNILERTKIVDGHPQWTTSEKLGS